MAAALAGSALGLAAVLWPTPPVRLVPASGGAATSAPLTAAATVTSALFGATDRTLTLPAGVTGVVLAAIPDRLLNDPPAVRLRTPVQIRGTLGIASIDAPWEIAWTEAGYWYWMRSVDLSVSQLTELAGALR